MSEHDEETVDMEAVETSAKTHPAEVLRPYQQDALNDVRITSLVRLSEQISKMWTGCNVFVSVHLPDAHKRDANDDKVFGRIPWGGHSHEDEGKPVEIRSYSRDDLYLMVCRMR